MEPYRMGPPEPLPRFAVKALMVNGLSPNDVDTLCRISASVFLRLPLLGRRTVNEIKRVVGTMGRRLGDTDNPIEIEDFLTPETLQHRINGTSVTKKKKLFRLLRSRMTSGLPNYQLALMAGCSSSYVCEVKNEFYTRKHRESMQQGPEYEYAVGSAWEE